MLLQVNGALYHSLYMYIYWARKQVLKEGYFGAKSRKREMYAFISDPCRPKAEHMSKAFVKSENSTYTTSGISCYRLIINLKYDYDRNGQGNNYFKRIFYI